MIEPPGTGNVVVPRVGHAVDCIHCLQVGRDPAHAGAKSWNVSLTGAPPMLVTVNVAAAGDRTATNRRRSLLGEGAIEFHHHVAAGVTLPATVRGADRLPGAMVEPGRGDPRCR